MAIDKFDRPDSISLDAPWSESESFADTLAIEGGRLRCWMMRQTNVGGYPAGIAKYVPSKSLNPRRQWAEMIFDSSTPNGMSGRHTYAGPAVRMAGSFDAASFLALGYHLPAGGVPATPAALQLLKVVNQDMRLWPPFELLDRHEVTLNPGDVLRALFEDETLSTPPSLYGFRNGVLVLTVSNVIGIQLGGIGVVTLGQDSSSGPNAYTYWRGFRAPDLYL